jgi:D-aminopeptidase
MQHPQDMIIGFVDRIDNNKRVLTEFLLNAIQLPLNTDFPNSLL